MNKIACATLSLLTLVALMAIVVMVKFAVDATDEAAKKKSEQFGPEALYSLSRKIGVIELSDNASTEIAERFPYVAAVLKNSSSTWSFSCFGSIILVKWIVTPAHCRRTGFTHRVFLYHDFVRKSSHTYPILFWRVHEKYQPRLPSMLYNIAVAKLNVEYYPFAMKSAGFDDGPCKYSVAAVWKTVSTMDKRLFLTNDFDKLDLIVAPAGKCYESFGIHMDDSLICIDLSSHDDCFIHEYGPIFSGDKVVGVLATKPADCDTKLAVFTNVSYFTNWILKTTRTTYYG